MVEKRGYTLTHSCPGAGSVSSVGGWSRERLLASGRCLCVGERSLMGVVVGGVGGTDSGETLCFGWQRSCIKRGVA